MVEDLRKLNEASRSSGDVSFLGRNVIMNAKLPCYDCIVQVACSKICDKLFDLYSRLIKSYIKYGDKSLLFKHAIKEDYAGIKILKERVDAGDDTILMINNHLSKTKHVLLRTGKVESYVIP